MSASESVTISEVPAELQPPAPPEPVEVPEKFRNEDGTVNTDALLKSYVELEKTRGTPKTEDTGLEVKPEPKVDEKSDPKGVLGDDLYAEIEGHYAEHGGLSEELYTKLAEKGISRKFADAFIEGQKVISTKYEQDVTSIVGGIDEYRKIQSWAKDALSAEEADMVNEAVTSGNVTRAKMAVEYLKSRFVASEGSSPKLVQGSATSDSSGYMSRDEYAAAISDKRYGKDPRFTREVEEKLARSSYWR